MTELLAWLPIMDGQTIFSLVVGIMVTLGTFYLGYKQTIGAREERIRAANLDLAAAVLKRVAVERERMTGQQYTSMMRTRAYRLNVPTDRLLPLSQVLSFVLADTIENSFLDKQSKAAVIEVIEQSAAEPDTTPKSDGKAQEKLPALLGVLGFASVAAGVASSAVATINLEKIRDFVDGAGVNIVPVFSTILVAGAAVVVVGMAVIRMIQLESDRTRIFRKTGKSPRPHIHKAGDDNTSDVKS